ncbi:Importin subunit alpha-4 [Glycine soja]|uniref:importin subunit alpha-4 n=1 Tax=Glycine max TaxID=3847 RepID=UPI00023375BD|nr:importin subunit alpha-4 [Glycine max]|eukprot:XP_003520790.1 importin subunit alpha-4 [Glycine max]
MSLRPGSGSASAWATRKKSYKSGIDPREIRRRREEDLFGIRKNKRHDTLFNKRTQTHTTHSRNTFLEAISAMVDHICSEFPPAELEKTRHAEILSSLAAQCPSIDDVIEQGIVPRFATFLSRDDAPQLQLGAILILTSIACGSSQHKRVIVELGLVPSFVNLLSSSSNDDIKEEIVCALGFIAIDSPSYRDLVLNHGVLLPLLSLLNPLPRLSMVRVTTWTLYSLVRGKPPVNFEQVKPVLPVLHQLIHQTDEEVVADACLALSYLSEVSIDKIQDIIDAGVCPKLVELLQCQSDKVVLPALRTLGNIVTGDDAQTQVVIDNGVLPCLCQVLTREYKKMIHKEACWTISNIAGGNRAQIQAVIKANIIPPLIQILQHAEFDVKKESAWAILSITVGGSRDHIRFVAAQGCIKGLCDLLSCPDPEVVSICLEGLENILWVGEADKEVGLHDSVNIYAQRVEECEGLDKIQKLLVHDNDEIFEMALRILKKFWPVLENDLEAILDLHIEPDGEEYILDIQIAR